MVPRGPTLFYYPRLHAFILSGLLLIECIMSLKLLELRVPAHVPLGTRAKLSCRWQLGPADSLYSVKWYKDGKEFFRHVPRDVEPRRKFPLPGVDVEEITEEFCDQMQHLNVLNIRDNKLEVLPENISLLQKLKRLDLTNNNLNKLPRNLGLLSQLQSISMEGNRLSFVRQDVIRGGTDRMMKFLRDRITEEIVNETRCTESEWPDKYTMKKSQALMLPARDLSVVPDDLFIAAADAQVHIVDICKNKLTTVPVSICHIRETLSQLVLSSNNIADIPPEISRCVHLQYLDLGKNCLSDLPLELGYLKSMRELVICNNKFKNIPRCVYELDNLEILLAAENQITEINVSSDALAKLKKLAVLDLSNNSIITVPPELGNFTHLRSLELMGNCFRQPRHAILAKGTASVLSYLRDRIPTN